MSNRQHIILAGDIGGTKTNLALFGGAGNSLSLLREQRYPSTGYPGLNAMIRDFLGQDGPPVLAAGFGVPGVVSAGSARNADPEPYEAPAVARRSPVDATLVGRRLSDPPVCARFSPTSAP